MSGNADSKVVEGFGDEWSRFDQQARSESDLKATFDRYFSVFPWIALPDGARGFDLGCGTGRWARFVAPRVGELLCIDASEAALSVARRNLVTHHNVRFLQASAGDLPLVDGEFDFGYSLGVLHHTPDPQKGLTDAVRTLASGAPFLLYVYYALDNRPAWYRVIWRLSDLPRRAISRLPMRPRYWAAQAIAAVVYLPLARTARLIERLGRNPAALPLAAYRDKPFYVMRTDALDRFGTRIEHRFSRADVVELMRSAGLTDIEVSEGFPYWCAVGRRSASPSA